MVELPARHLHFAPQHHRGATPSADRLWELDGRKREALGSFHRWPELWWTALISRRVTCCPIYSSRCVSRQIVRRPHSRLCLDLTTWFFFFFVKRVGQTGRQGRGKNRTLRAKTLVWNLRIKCCAMFFLVWPPRRPLESALIIKKIPLLTELSGKQESPSVQQTCVCCSFSLHSSSARCQVSALSVTAATSGSR